MRIFGLKEISMTDKKIIIITDSSASLPDEIRTGLDIRVIPLWLVWDNESFLDGIDIQPQAFYQRLKNSSTLPSSTQPSVPVSYTHLTLPTSDLV